MQYMKSQRTREGFTLVELLIVSVMLAVVSLAIYASFNSGIKIWQKAKAQAFNEDLNIFFDKFSSDLRNTFRFTKINFRGDESQVEFATLVKSARLQETAPGKAIYIYDRQRKELARRLMDFSQVSTGEEPRAQQSLKNVTSLKFTYYTYDPEEKECLWEDEWQGREGLPLAVRMELELDAEQEYKFVRTVSVPVSG